MQENNRETIIDKFLTLKGAIRELWLIFISKIFTILAYSLVNSTLVLWLSSDLKMSDSGAGFIIASWSTFLTIFTVMVGSLVDAVGIRKSLIAGFSIAAISRLVMAIFAIKWIALPLGLLPLALGEALQTPVMVAAVKRFSSTKQRSMAFSVYYAMMNVGFAIAGWTFDKIRAGLGEYGHYTLPLIGLQISTYQTIIFLGMLFTLPNILIAWLLIRNGIEVTDKGPVIVPEEIKYKDKSFLEASILSFKDALADWLRIFSGLWTQTRFYKFLAFFALVVFTKLILYHMYYTFPKFAIRELGEGAPVGRIFGMLNAVIVIILAPIIGALTTKISAYRAVIIGTSISSLSVFLLAINPQIFLPLANGYFGHAIAKWLDLSGQVNPLYCAIVLCVVLYSIGECFYSPRLYEYPTAIAPKGQEGSYLALSMLPYFFAKFFVGTISGFLLEKYCPAEGARNTQMLWFIVAAMAMITPIGLLIYKKQIKVEEQGRED